MRGRYIDYAKTKLKQYNKELFLASSSDDSFVLCKNKTIIARIYKKRNHWYIWYEATSHSEKVENFSLAIRQLEEEFS